MSRSAFGALALLLPWPCTVLGQVTTAQYDNARTGAYTTETQLTPRTVNTVTFGKIHVITVDGDVYAQVLYLPSVNIPSKGTHAVIYIATEHNSVYAFDAAAPAEPLWHIDLSAVAEGAEPVPASDVRCPSFGPKSASRPPQSSTPRRVRSTCSRERPGNEKTLEETDGDLGSGGPLLIPDHFLSVGGKDGSVYLIDRDRMGKFDPAANRGAVQTMKAPGLVMGASAYWNGHVYSLWSNDVVKDFAFANGRLSAAPVSKGTHVFTDPGATPTISANGTTDGIVWVVETRTWNGADRHAILHAFDAADVGTELYSSESNAARDRAGTALRFAMPTVAAGRVYIGTKGEVDVYGILRTRSGN